MSRYWIQVGRPLTAGVAGAFAGSRPVLVDGDCVGWIIPETGIDFGLGLAHRARSAGWAVYAARTLAIGAMRLGRVLGSADNAMGDGTALTLVGQGARFTDALEIAREWDGWLCGVWSEMSGSHGYMPDAFSCGVGRAAAIASIVDRFELGGRRARAVARDLYVELNSRRDGAEYASVQRCECERCSEVTIAVADTWECRLCE